MTELELKAIIFAFNKHDEINHVRKYDSEPYINHPMRVTNKIREVEHTPEMLAAAWLHDTVEDTNTDLEEILSEFGAVVADLVENLTDVAISGDGNRAFRVAQNREHTAIGSSMAHTIKLADLIDNSLSIIEHDKSFAKVYMREKTELLAVLTDGNKQLFDEAQKIVNDWNSSQS